MKLQYHKAQTAKGHRGGPQEIVYTEILAAIRPAEWPDYSSDSLSSSQSGLSFNLLSLQICEEEMRANQNDGSKLMVEPYPQVRYKMISAGFFPCLRAEISNPHR